MSDLAEQMEADALEAMKLTRKHFVVELDFTPASIEQLESIIDDVEFTLRGGKSEENIELLTRVWGAYLGEVIRRHHNGEWIEKDASPAVQIPNTTLSTHDQVRQRLTVGAGHNLVKYCQDLI